MLRLSSSLLPPRASDVAVGEPRSEDIPVELSNAYSSSSASLEVLCLQTIGSLCEGNLITSQVISLWNAAKLVNESLTSIIADALWLVGTQVPFVKHRCVGVCVDGVSETKTIIQ